MALPSCSANQYIRGDMACADVPGDTETTYVAPNGLCVNQEGVWILELMIFVFLVGVMVLAYRTIKLWRTDPGMLHDVCRRVHAMNQPCLFTDAQKELLEKYGHPLAFEHAVMNAIGEISISEAQKAIAEYRCQWDELGEPTL